MPNKAISAAEISRNRQKRNVNLPGPWILSYQHFCDFSLNKSFKTYPGPMLPIGSRNRLLI
jgi:hypothetical protein